LDDLVTPIDRERAERYAPDAALAREDESPDEEPPGEPVPGTASVPGTTQHFTPEDAPVPHSHMDEH
jgi:hypothetical protein